MNSQTLLDSLCEIYQIMPEYQDIWGKRHLASQETRQQLLAAMDVPTETEAVMQQALARAEAAAWRGTLPPVQVVWENEYSIQIKLGIAETQANSLFSWTLVQEDGRRHSGEFRPADLDLWRQQLLEGERWQRRTLVLSEVPDSGYHTLELQNLEHPDTPAAIMSLIVAPRSCYQPEAVSSGRRIWGPAIQLYALRSARNWGHWRFYRSCACARIFSADGSRPGGIEPTACTVSP